MNSTPEQLRFASIPAHSVRADFAGGGLSSDLGPVLLRGVDLSRTGIHQANPGAILTGAGILSLRVNDPSRALPVADRARWLLAVEGRFR